MVFCRHGCIMPSLPPPEHHFNPDLPGLTWVDLVFPLFLFALGAAIPVALTRRIKSGEKTGKLILRILGRGFLLGSFAIFLQHIKPLNLNPEPNPRTWLLALLGFFFMFLMYTRFPLNWNTWLRRLLRFGGWGAAGVYLGFISFPDGSGFSLQRSDIILVVLTNAAVFGAIIWIFTREKILLRLGVMSILVALRLSAPIEGWVKMVWDFSPVPWIYKLYYLQYLLIVLPGTIAGDILISRRNGHREKNKSAPTDMWVTILLIILLILNLIGLQARWVGTTLMISILICMMTYYLWCREKGKSGDSIRLLILWATFWLVLGLILEPFEGGIKKDKSTLSYYFVTTGLSFSILIAFSIWIDILKTERWFRLLIANGQNPMIAYVGFGNLVWPVLALTGLEKFIRLYTPGPLPGFIRSLVYTLLVAFVVSIFTRKQLFWRT